MASLDLILVLFAPCVASFVVGGGYWYYCQQTTETYDAAYQKFRFYLWGIGPALLSAYAAWLYFTDFVGARSGVSSSLSPLTSDWIVTGAAIIVVFALSVWLTSVLSRGAEGRVNREMVLTRFIDLPSLVVLAPIAEEFVFRSIGMQLAGAYGVIGAALISSVAFALIHFRPALIAMSFAAGLVLFGLYLLTDNLLLAIIAHSTVNGLMWVNDQFVRYRLRS